ncbi:MAG: hypothetical protein WBG48_11385 [Pricia sp.]
MKTRIIYTILCPLLLCFLFSSCGPLIFKANFDADTVGDPPNPNPPGDPSDDEIKGNCGIRVVNSSILDSNAMRFFNEPNCAVGLMWFESGNVATSNKFLNYTFIGYPESTSHRKFTLSFAGGHFRPAFTILYDGGTMYLTDGTYTNHNIGNYTANQKQTFLVGINRETNTYSVTIARAGTSNIQLSDRPVKEATFWGQSAYILNAFYDPDDTNSSTNGFVFDSITINKEKVE